MERLRFEFSGHLRDLILDKDKVVIGRSENVDVTIVTDTMSRSHFEVSKEAGRWVVRDLGSSNGTRLNGTKLGQPELHLHPGDVIKAGGIDFVFSPVSNDGIAQSAVLEVLGEGDAVESSVPLYLAATIGRAEGNDLVVDDAQVSSHHCAVEMRAGTPMLRDLGSTNGTLFKGERITETALKDGDIFFLGLGMRVRFSLLAIKPAGAALAEGVVAPVARQTEHVPEEIPGIPLASSFVLVLVFAGIGAALAFFLPQLAGEPPVVNKGPDAGVAAPTTPALGFEAAGGLGGWEVSGVNAGKAGAGIDRKVMRQGSASLAIRLEPPVSTLVIQTTEPQELALGQGGSLTAWVRGSAASNTSVVVSAVFMDGESALIGQSDLSRNNLRDWSQLTVPLRSWRPVNTVKLRLEVSGSAGTLWLDGMTVKAKEGGGPPPSLSVVSGQVRGASGEGPLVTFTAGSGKGPVVVQAMGVSNEGEVTDGPWICENAEPRGGGFSAEWASVRGRGAAVTCFTGLAPVTEPYEGIRSSFRVSKNAALAIRLRTQESSDLVVWDYVGNPIPVVNPPEAGVGSVSGVSVGGMHFMLASGGGNMAIARIKKEGRGWEVMLNFPGANRDTPVQMDVFGMPAMDFARHSGLLDEIARIAPRDAPEFTTAPFHGSAALNRAEYLAGLNALMYPGLPAKGREWAEFLNGRAEAHWAKANTQAGKAREWAQRGMPVEARNAASGALASLNQLIREFPAVNSRMVEAYTLRDEMGRIAAGGSGTVAPVNPTAGDADIRHAPPVPPTDPAAVSRAVETAASLLRQAEEARTAGNWLRAHLFADNIAYNLHYTPSAERAAKLKAAIEADWDKEAERAKFVEPRMKKARDAAAAGERIALREAAQEVLARYPYCEEALELRTLLIAAGE